MIRGLAAGVAATSTDFKLRHDRDGALAHERIARGSKGKMNDPDARLWHPWLGINRVLRVMLQTRWSAEAWAQVRVEFRKALALRSEIRHAGWFN